MVVEHGKVDICEQQDQEPCLYPWQSPSGIRYVQGYAQLPMDGTNFIDCRSNRTERVQRNAGVRMQSDNEEYDSDYKAISDEYLGDFPCKARMKCISTDQLKGMTKVDLIVAHPGVDIRTIMDDFELDICATCHTLRWAILLGTTSDQRFCRDCLLPTILKKQRLNALLKGLALCR